MKLLIMVAEANYGGRVSDPKYSRLICVLLKTFYKFSPIGLYYCPPEGELEAYKIYIKDL